MLKSVKGVGKRAQIIIIIFFIIIYFTLNLFIFSTESKLTKAFVFL